MNNNPVAVRCKELLSGKVERQSSSAVSNKNSKKKKSKVNRVRPASSAKSSDSTSKNSDSEKPLDANQLALKKKKKKKKKRTGLPPISHRPASEYDVAVLRLYEEGRTEFQSEVARVVEASISKDHVSMLDSLLGADRSSISGIQLMEKAAISGDLDAVQWLLRDAINGNKEAAVSLTKVYLNDTDLSYVKNTVYNFIINNEADDPDFKFYKGILLYSSDEERGFDLVIESFMEGFQDAEQWISDHVDDSAIYARVLAEIPVDKYSDKMIDALCRNATRGDASSAKAVLALSDSDSLVCYTKGVIYEKGIAVDSSLDKAMAYYRDSKTVNGLVRYLQMAENMGSGHSENDLQLYYVVSSKGSEWAKDRLKSFAEDGQPSA